jgi:carotenoid cleavage dioxygenase-like enzyme
MNAVGNVYLQGNFAPVTREISAPAKLVSGAVPDDLRGYFLRIGPNPRYVQNPALHHWFDGDGMIHSLHFTHAGVHYRNRFVETAGFRQESIANKALWGGLNSKLGLWHRHGLVKNAANTNLVWHANRLLALWEGGQAHEIRLPDLSTVKAEGFSGINYPMSAHPHVCPETAEMRVVSYFMPTPPHARYFVFSADGKMTHEAVLDLPRGVMMHNSAMTKNYTLILDLPTTWSWRRVLAGEHSIDWEPEHGARIGVMPRLGSSEDVRWFSVRAGYVFHTVNAYEDGEEVVLEAVRSEIGAVLRQLDVEDLARKQEGYFHQWRLNMTTGAVSERRLSGTSVEFPRINPAREGRPFRHAWAARHAGEPGEPKFNGIVKMDRGSKSEPTVHFSEHRFGPRCFNGEAVFVPRSRARGEDDGYLLCHVHDERENRSYCHVLDAANMGAPALAVLELPARVPYGFHAAWVDEREVARQHSSALAAVGGPEPAYAGGRFMLGLLRLLASMLKRRWALDSGH